MQFQKIEIPSGWKEEFSAYPHGLSIWEALSTTITTVNEGITEVNASVERGLIAIEQASILINNNVQEAFNTFKLQLQSDFTDLEADLLSNINTALSDVYTKSQVYTKSEVDAQLNDKATNARVDEIITTPVPTGEIIAQEIIDARQGEASVGANIAGIKAQYAGKKIKVVTCILRNTGAGWFAISDSEHSPLNILSVTNDTNDVIITYDFTAKKVLSLVAVPDETFNTEGYSFGASVGKTMSKINIFRHSKSVGGLIIYNGSTWNVSNTTGIISASFSGGILTLTHASMEGYVCNASTRDGVYLPAIGSLGTTTSQVKFFDYTGNLITVPDVNMKVYFQRSVPSAKIRPDLLAIPEANIWVYGVFEVE